MKQGKVWLVGAGPGDIGLFTLKGMEVLSQAEVVVYDSLVGQGVLAKDTFFCKTHQRRKACRQAHHAAGADQSGAP